MTAATVGVLTLAVAGVARAAPAASCDAPAMPPEMLAQARQARVYPDFCSIPPTPTDVRAAAGFKTAVVDTRLAGARLIKRTGPESFSLEGTDAFAAAAKRDAAPPPPMATPADAPTDAFISQLKARASPPPPQRKR